MTENKKASYLTEKAVGRINNVVIASVLFGMCISSFRFTFGSRHISQDWAVFMIVGLVALVFIIMSLEYLGRFRAKKEARS